MCVCVCVSADAGDLRVVWHLLRLGAVTQRTRCILDRIAFATHRGASAGVARVCTPFRVACRPNVHMASATARAGSGAASRKRCTAWGVQGVNKMNGDRGANLPVGVHRRLTRYRALVFGPRPEQSAERTPPRLGSDCTHCELLAREMRKVPLGRKFQMPL